MFKSIRINLGESKSTLTNRELLGWVENLRLAFAIEAGSATFYLLEMGAGPGSEIDPLELMMAYEPSGVVCYFSALAFHSLTSQVPSHHHVAVLTDNSIPDDSQGARHGERVPHQSGGDTQREKALTEKSAHIKQTRNTANVLGRPAYSYLDIPYYLTRRKQRLIPGVQTRSHGPRGRFRITTIEQSLLDTLYKPLHCGGPAVVLEAWQKATSSGSIDEERITEYLIQMDYQSTTRRVGAVLNLLGYSPGAVLKSCLDQAKQKLVRDAPHAQISLLPGFEYTNLDHERLVKLP